ILRTIKRIAGDSPDEAHSTLSSPERLELERQLAQDAERAIEVIAARHLGVHLKAAIFQRARRRRVHTIALVRHEGEAVTDASQRHALAGAILERYQAAALQHGWLPINQIVWCELHGADSQPSSIPTAAEDIPTDMPLSLSDTSIRSP